MGLSGEGYVRRCVANTVREACDKLCHCKCFVLCSASIVVLRSPALCSECWGIACDKSGQISWGAGDDKLQPRRLCVNVPICIHRLQHVMAVPKILVFDVPWQPELATVRLPYGDVHLPRQSVPDKWLARLFEESFEAQPPFLQVWHALLEGEATNNVQRVFRFGI